MEAKKVRLRIRDSVSGLQRILQIFSRRGYEIKSMSVQSAEGFKDVVIEFPADFYIYRTAVGQLKKMVDLVKIEHDKIDYDRQALIEMENLF